MTTTAKILVVLNLLLAVLFMGFSAASFNARLGLQTRIGGLEKEKKDAADKVAVERQSADKSDLETKDLSKQLNLAKKQYEEYDKQTKNTIDNLTTENAGYKKQADVFGLRLKQVAEEATQRKEEIDQARKQNQDLIAKNVTNTNELSTARDQIQDLKNQLERVNDKVRVSEDRYRLVLNYLGSLKMTLPSEEELRALTESSQPPAVEGVVREVRDGGKIMTISLGENDGLRTKHRLSVFRTNPAKYIGEAEVIYTTPNTAVIRPTDTLLAPPKVGDRVGISSLLNRG